MEMEHMETLCWLYDKLLDAAHNEISAGIEKADTQEMGEVIDMIKDLAEAKKDCYKACYYKTVIEAMESGESRYGYHERIMPLYDESYYPDGYSDREIAKRWKMGEMKPRTSYEEYLSSKKHYTETHAEADKTEMSQHIREHLNETIHSMLEMYHDADPELRKKMKADMTKLCADMV